MIKATIATAVLALSLSACTGRVDEHGARYRTDEIRVERYNHYDHYDGYPYDKKGRYHCPPGHAKKGWC